MRLWFWSLLLLPCAHGERSQSPFLFHDATSRRRRRRLVREELLRTSLIHPKTTTSIHRGGATAATATATAATTKKSSMAASIFNLVNNVAGAGILALSAGQAAGTGYVPAMLICALLGLASAHTFCLIGDACEMTHEQDFKGLWSRTLGPSTTYLVDGMIAILCLACAVIYSGILGDVSTQLLPSSSAWNVRTTNIVAITIAALLPMSLIRNLSALAFTSILGFTAIMHTVLFVVLRAVDGTYRLGTGRFVVDRRIPFPTFQRSSLWNMDFTSLVLASNLGLAYVAHYNSPSFYRELEHSNAKRFRTMVMSSFALLILLYISTMVAGYSTFGDTCQGNLLLNYHPDDRLALLGRVATFFSILFGFPLVASGARESIMSVAASFGLDWRSHHFWVVAAILTVVTVISVTVHDVKLVVGLTGAAMGSCIVYVCPAILHDKAMKVVASKQRQQQQASINWNLLLVPFGIFIGSLGVYMTIQDAL